MGITKDLTKNKYGYLTAIRPTEKRVQRKVVWECLCDCGKLCEVISTNLTSGRTKSCGCKQYEFIANHYREKCPKYGDVINGTEILDFEYRPDSRGYNECYILCKCKFCGNQFWSKKTCVEKGNTKSCGCIKNSSGEATIIKMLDDNNIYYEREKIFTDCYYKDIHNKCRFDFYINNKYLVEYDGEQHFIDYSGTSSWFNENSLVEIQARDKYKNEWCKSHNIPLIRIPYYKLKTLCIDDLLLETTQYLI